MTSASAGCEFISLVLPAFNEELNIRRVYESIRRVFGASPNLRIYTQSRNMPRFVIVQSDAAAPRAEQ